MDKYDNLGLIGEGSYGLVMKCLHRETGQLVAIKKFLETDEDKTTKKIALREIRMLKQLRHENLVNLIEVFRRKRRIYLVFEYVDHTILDDLEASPNGLDERTCRKYIFQVVRGIQFCHSQNVIHRDIKPENVLVSKLGVVKLCDFGFARMMTSTCQSCTDYVATRWYRSPELLVGDTKYGREVDIWAIGCLLAEMLSGEPLFPGDSDIDQIHLIIRCLGPLINKHQTFLENNPMFMGLKLTQPLTHSLENKFPTWSSLTLNFCKACLNLNPSQRPSCDRMLVDPFFCWDNFSTEFIPELQIKINEEFRQNPLLKRPENPTTRGNQSAKFDKIPFGQRNMSGHNKRNRYLRQNSTDFDAKVSTSQSVFPSSPNKRNMSYLFPHSMKSSAPHKDEDVFGRSIFYDHPNLTRFTTTQDCSLIGKNEKDSSATPSWLQSNDPMPPITHNEQEPDNYAHRNYSSTFFNIFNPIVNINRKKSFKKSSKLSVDNCQDLVSEYGGNEVSRTTAKKKVDPTPIHRQKVSNVVEDTNAFGKQSTSNDEFSLPNVSGFTGGLRKGKRSSQNLHPVSTQALQFDLFNSNVNESHTSQSRHSTPSPRPPFATSYGSNLPHV